MTLKHTNTALALRAGLAATLATACMGFSTLAGAAAITMPLDFTAQTQSLWGPNGGSADFGASGGGDLVANIGYGYDFGASSGTVSAAYSGGLSVNYADSLLAPGNTTFALSFNSNTNGARIVSDLGAHANASVAGIDIIDEDYGLNVNQGFTAQLGESGTGHDTVTLGNSGVDVVVASAGVNYNIEQTDTLSFHSIAGTLVASLEGTATTVTKDFVLFDSGISFDLGLSDAGNWNVSVQNLTLNNTFSTRFAAQLQPFVTYVSGVKFCSGLWGIPYPCGTKTSDYSITLASLDIYSGTPFALDFGTTSLSNAFSIAVDEVVTPGNTVPAPATLALLGIALPGLLLSRRRRVST